MTTDTRGLILLVVLGLVWLVWDWCRRQPPQAADAASTTTIRVRTGMPLLRHTTYGRRTVVPKGQNYQGFVA